MSGSSSKINPALVRPYELGPNETAWPTVALHLGALAVQLSCAAAGFGGLVPVPLAVLVCSVAAYCQFTVAHDAAHKSLSKIVSINESCGSIAALVLFGPFEAFRRNHLHHHAHTNDPAEDPDFWVAGATVATTVLRCFTMLEMHYWSYFTRLGRRDGVYARSVGTVALIVLAFASAAWSGHAKALVLYWFVPAQLAGAALGFLFDYWPHRPHTGRGRLKDTAAIAPRYLDPLFLAQNIHLLHHLFPTVPWYRYRAAFGQIEEGIRAEGGLIWDLRTALARLRPSASAL
ncbi:MAG: fatty acid desaturase [Elusimicrobia bacterium]|nr:fatty acid desaturase [Elusimicrobiota bacterium]